ncbi:hypothetical protein D3C86_1440520 [compost metagenome]
MRANFSKTFSSLRAVIVSRWFASTSRVSANSMPPRVSENRLGRRFRIKLDGAQRGLSSGRSSVMCTNIEYAAQARQIVHRPKLKTSSCFTGSLRIWKALAVFFIKDRLPRNSREVGLPIDLRVTLFVERLHPIAVSGENAAGARLGCVFDGTAFGSRNSGASLFGGPLLAGKRPLACQDASNLCLLSDLKSIVHLDSKVANCAFQLGMPEQQL